MGLIEWLSYSPATPWFLLPDSYSDSYFGSDDLLNVVVCHIIKPAHTWGLIVLSADSVFDDIQIILIKCQTLQFSLNISLSGYKSKFRPVLLGLVCIIRYGISLIIFGNPPPIYELIAF